MKIIYVLKICVIAAFFATLLTGAIFMIRSSEEGQQQQIHPKNIYDKLKPEGNSGFNQKNDATKAKIDDKLQDEHKSPVEHKSPRDEQIPPPLENPLKAKVIQESVAVTIPTVAPSILKELNEVKNIRSPSIHIFYYPWYGTPETNGKFRHWNHEYIKPWNPTDKHIYPQGRHNPPDDIASVYYPALGPYSSWDPKVIEKHMKWVASAGIDVLVVSWYPKGMADQEATPWDSLIPQLLNATENAKLKMTFHLEPYKTRTAESIRADIQYILEQYGTHPAFYRTTWKDSKSEFPLFYIYDSYLIPPEEWTSITSSNGSLTIRNTVLDSLLIGLYVGQSDQERILKSGFDGLYTYFAADGFSHGSTMANWPALSTFCVKNNLIFIPSVGPGYNDSRVRPWNSANTRERNGGQYYRDHLKMAHTAKADIVSITSFNEWHEGTQIEPAVPHVVNNGTSFEYPKYERGPEQYLEITLEMIKTYFTPHHENIPEKIARIV